MIGRLAYVICDECGNPATQPVDDAREARKVLAQAGGKRIEGRDLCAACARKRRQP